MEGILSNNFMPIWPGEKVSNLTFQYADQDGIVRAGQLMLDRLRIKTPNFFPALRTVQNPNELELMMTEKAQRVLEHVSGAVVRLQLVPQLIEPNTQSTKPTNRKQTVFVEGEAIDKSMYELYYDNNLLLCDPQMEKTFFIIKPEIDKFIRLDISPELKNYFTTLKEEIKNQNKSGVARIRNLKYTQLWHGSSKNDTKIKNKILTDLTKYQLQHFRVSVPISHLIQTLDDMKNNIDINEYCQGLSYQAGKECATYLLFHKKAIEDDEIMGKAFEYLRSNKQPNLVIMKFYDLDLHCPVNYRARVAFRSILADINSIKESRPDTAFMLLDGGTQYYVATQSYDIVSTTLTGYDRDITGGQRKKGVTYYPFWYDEHKMWPRPTNDTPIPNPEHCYVCSITPNFDLDSHTLAKRRRIHRLNDLNQDANAICDAVSTKDVPLLMNQRVARAEFSYARDLIFHQ